MKTYYAQNKEKLNANTVARRNANKNEYLSYQYAYRAERTKNDPQFKLLNSMRKSVCKAMKSKTKRTLQIWDVRLKNCGNMSNRNFSRVWTGRITEFTAGTLIIEFLWRPLKPKKS